MVKKMKEVAKISFKKRYDEEEKGRRKERV